MAPPNLPLIYRLTFLYIEPCVALAGVYVALFDPVYLLRVIAPTATYDASMRMLFEQLAGSWLTLSFVLAVLGRQVTDWRIFRLVVMTVLVSDVANCISIVRTLGMGTILDAKVWRLDDWVNVVSSFPPVVVKVALLMGVGIDEGKMGKLA
ncbi:uncharacterized protein BCR38DRAFT_334875 [Pseudomassariella vexata]|uniref:DUF7704 domain-containing protein n=1 Tax=Pseudomassariella vexata TaxID=1141098 RepID=A0A1Y2EBI0_9PEZI|nr:uncharacterized protein BCR38DRAFT_334875 [Pseudomassariella vexata]ORY68920.1 hypothetical protein BCR38DRAFT_334875 [Pseudomassariella vexata]